MVDEDGNYEGWSGGGVNVNDGSNGNSTGSASGLEGKNLTVVQLFPNLDQEALNVAVREGYSDEGAANMNGIGSSFYASLPNFSVGISEEQALMNTNGIVDWEESSPLAAITDGTTPAANNSSGTYHFTAPTTLQPVGIIDLECYSAVNRSKINPTVLELAGDSYTNPDLRSFYFQSATIEDAESWTKALLSDRHQSLKDETDAYRQVCDSFPLQLQACSEMIDAAEAKAEEMEREAYGVRSVSEEGRRKVVSAVREILERRCWETASGSTLSASSSSKKGKGGKGKQHLHPTAFEDDYSLGGSSSRRGGGRSSARSDCSYESKNTSIAGNNSEDDSLPVDSVLDSQYAKLETNRTAFLKELEAALSSPSAVATSNVVPPVQTLVDYTSTIVSSFADLRIQLRKYEKDLRKSVQKDQSQLEAFKKAMEEKDAIISEAEKRHSVIRSELTSELDASQREIQELSKQLDAHRMEFGMYQNATKTKLSELQQHKKILKREVIDLRKKIDESGCESTTVAHEYEKIKSSYQAEKERNATLERYINRLEKQVGVQQNMMEMMSQTGGGASFVGKIVGPGVTQSDSMSVMSNNLRRMTSCDNNSVMSGNLRRMTSCDNNSMGGGSQFLATNTTTNATTTPTKPQLLPPGSSSSKNNNQNRTVLHDVSPLPTPTFYKEPEDANLGGLVNDDVEGGEEERDASNAYYRSETSSEIGSPIEANNVTTASSDQVVAKPSLNDDMSNGAGNNDGVSVRSTTTGQGEPGSIKANEKMLSPKTSDENNHAKANSHFQSTNVESSTMMTPIHSNNSVTTAHILNTVINKRDSSSDRQLMDMPKLEVKGEESVDNRMKLLSMTDRLFPVSAMPAPDVDQDEDDMDDSKSRVSDITEDRTQRQIDDDLAERRKILLAYVHNASREGGGGGSSNVSLTMSSTQRRLETIENMIPNNNRGAGGGGMTRVDSLGDVASNASGGSRLSVAQRARLDAESKSNTHRASSPAPLRQRDDSSLSSSNMNNNANSIRSSSSVGGRSQATPASPGSETIGQSNSLQRSNSFFAKFGKLIENAVDKSVLGVHVPSEDDYEDDDDDVASEASVSAHGPLTMLSSELFSSYATHHYFVLF